MCAGTSLALATVNCSRVALPPRPKAQKQRPAVSFGHVVFLSFSSLEQHCPIGVSCVEVRFACTRQGGSQCDVDGKLSPRKTWEILCQHSMRLPSCWDIHVHVPQQHIEHHGVSSNVHFAHTFSECEGQLQSFDEQRMWFQMGPTINCAARQWRALPEIRVETPNNWCLFTNSHNKWKSSERTQHLSTDVVGNSATSWIVLGTELPTSSNTDQLLSGLQKAKHLIHVNSRNCDCGMVAETSNHCKTGWSLSPMDASHNNGTLKTDHQWQRMTLAISLGRPEWNLSATRTQRFSCSWADPQRPGLDTRNVINVFCLAETKHVMTPNMKGTSTTKSLVELEGKQKMYRIVVENFSACARSDKTSLSARRK